jgi:hypothetical protein
MNNQPNNNQITNQTMSQTIMPSPERIKEIEAFDNAWASLRGNPKRAEIIQQMIDSGTLMTYGQPRRKPRTTDMTWVDGFTMLALIAIAIFVGVVLK